MKFSFFLTATGVQLQVVQDGIHRWLQFFSSCICSLPPFPLCSHLPLLLPCPSLSSPVYGFLLQFHIFIVQFFLSPLLLPSAFCLQSQSLPSFSASLPCSAPESFLATVLLLLCRTWAPLRGNSCLPSVCSAQHQVTHRARQELALHSGGLEPEHRGSTSHVFLHSWQRKKVK